MHQRRVRAGLFPADDSCSGDRTLSGSTQAAAVSNTLACMGDRHHCRMTSSKLSIVEMCAGAGGEALGLERAGFGHSCLVELDRHACATLLANRPNWTVLQEDMAQFDARSFRGAAMVSGGLPCPPYSVAGRQLGAADKRDLFVHGLRVVEEVRPDAVMLENVKGMLSPKFDEVREAVLARFRQLGYDVGWRLLNACDFGVPQSRVRLIFVALRPKYAAQFSWPVRAPGTLPNVGSVLLDLMGAEGWRGADEWAGNAAGIAPTLVGGSKLHGGPDLGPTRARRAWSQLGVDGRSLADKAPDPGFNGMPRLTGRMAARIQGFPDSWLITGRKTAAYRQIANALPPAVAEAVGLRIRAALGAA